MNILSRLIPLATVLVCAQTWAVPGTPAWTDSIDPMVGDSSADFVVIGGDVAYVAGAGPFKGSPSSDADIRLRAYTVGDGAVLWEDVWDAGGIHQDDEVTDLTTAGGRVYVAGSSGTNTAGSNALVVRAYDGRNGQVLWEDHCGQFNSRATAIAADTSRIYVAGTCSPAPEGTGLIRAYSKTGIPTWQANDVALPLDIAVSGNQVVVAGADATGALVVHAYSANRGKLLWQARPATAQALSLRSAHLMLGAGMVYLAWEAVDGGGQSTDQIIAYTNNGASRWQADPASRINDLILDGGQVFAALQGPQGLMSVYAAHSGRLQWQDQPGTMTAPYSAVAITAGDRQVLVTGQAFNPTLESAPHFMVRAYGLDGKLLWEDETPTSTVQGAEAMDVAWSHGVAVAGGMDSRSQPPFGSTHWLVRAYSTSRGPHRP